VSEESPESLSGQTLERWPKNFRNDVRILPELPVQEDHVHLLIKVPPKISISTIVGILKGHTVIRIFNQFNELKQKTYWGNHFWSKGYCVDTVGLNEEMIRKYVKYQEKKDKRE